MQQPTTEQEQRFKVGEHVRLRRMYQATDAVIVEDRGLLAPGGRRVYRIRVLIPPGDGDQPDFEVTADDFVRVNAAA